MNIYVRCTHTNPDSTWKFFRFLHFDTIFILKNMYGKLDVVSMIGFMACLDGLDSRLMRHVLVELNSKYPDGFEIRIESIKL